jgi:hypothetical protein
MNKIDASIFTDDEWDMLMGILNILHPTPEIEYTSDNLHWMKREAFERKIKAAGNEIIVDHKPIYESLVKKLNITN